MNHPYFSIDPPSGKVQAGGTGQVSISFTALSLCTCHCTVRITIDGMVGEEGPPPLDCSVSARSVSGLLEERTYRGLESQTKLNTPLTLLVSKGLRNTTSSQGSREAQRLTGAGSGAVFDAGGEWLRRLRTTLTTSSSISHQKSPKSMETDPKTGLSIPTDLSNMFAVNYVLTQDRQTRKPKELKKMLAMNQAKRSARKSLRRPIGGDVYSISLADALEEEAKNGSMRINRDQRELDFLAELRQIQERETNSEFRVSDTFLGGTALTSDEMLTIIEARRQRQKMQSLDEWRELLQRKHSVGTSLSSGVSVETNASIASLCPELTGQENDVWPKRVQTVRRFIALVSKCIVRSRADRRLRCLQSALKAAQVTSREDCKRFVSEENAMAATGGEKHSSTRNSSHQRAVVSMTEVPDQNWTMAEIAANLPKLGQIAMEHALEVVETRRFEPDLSKLAVRGLPSFHIQRASESKHTEIKTTKALDIAEDVMWKDHYLLPMKVLTEYERMGYTPVLPPAIPSYFEREPSRSLRILELELSPENNEAGT